MEVNIHICDIFDIWYDYYDVHHNIYTFAKKLKLVSTVINTSVTSDISQTADDERGILLYKTVLMSENVNYLFSQWFVV